MAHDWLPARYTAPLAPDFPSRGDDLIRFAELAWTTPENPKGLQLDDWQRWLIRSVLEVYPEGHPRAGELRYRQVVISIPRQQGKSVIGSLLALWGLLMHVAGPYVLSIASSGEQARIVYDRVLYAIAQKPELKALFAKTTETRGIRTADGSGRYEIKAAKGAALQGLPNSLVIFDELHISKAEMWYAVVNGMVTRRNGLIIGITTAGDESSELLIDLYEQGRLAIEGKNERFGFFCWEAPEGCAVDDPEAILRSNPAVACGRIELETVLSDIQGKPEQDIRRYRLNQFVKGSGEAWLPTYMWTTLPEGNLTSPAFAAVSVSQSWGWASISLSAKVDGRIQTRYVATIEAPDLDSLTEACARLASRHRLTFVMEGNGLRDLALRLRERGLSAEWFNLTQMTQAASTAYAQIARQNVIHDHSPIVIDQISRGVRKNVGEHWRIVPVSGQAIDALMATVLSIYAAESITPYRPRLA